MTKIPFRYTNILLKKTLIYYCRTFPGAFAQKGNKIVATLNLGQITVYSWKKSPWKFYTNSFSDICDILQVCSCHHLLQTDLYTCQVSLWQN